MSDAAHLKHSPLNDLHQSMQARFVAFAGYSLPLHYAAGIIQEHLATRAGAGLFDVSHMGQIVLSGNIDALERLCPLDLTALANGQQRYSVFTNDRGGVCDDLIVTRDGGTLRLVVNASRRDADLLLLVQGLEPHGCVVSPLADHALLALQGPSSAKVIGDIWPHCVDLTFMSGTHAQFESRDCYVTRSGYTGEDGFEISVPVEVADNLARRLLSGPDVTPAGLGARDSLRLEAGLCLYGHELHETISPVEAGLGWTIAQTRRAGSRRGGFPGANIILEQLSEPGAARKRVGLRPEGRALLRDGMELRTTDNNPVGHVTSGGYSPSLRCPIAMGLVKRECAREGTTLRASVRGAEVAIKVTLLPFVPARQVRRAP